MIFNILRQQIIGVINLSLPLIILYQINPELLINNYGRLLCSVVMGLIVYYLNLKTTKNQANTLTYAPTGNYKQELEQLVSSCNIDPQKINLRYSYTNEMVAMCMLNTVSIDPLFWHDVDKDPEMLKVKDIIEQHILPTASEEAKNRISKIKEILSPGAQNFIFKHELAHVFYNYSNKKLIIIGLIGLIATYIGLTVSVITLYISGLLAILLGILAAAISDLLLSYASNLFFKVREEKNADIFAAKYSSSQDILAAADFFEKHQKIVESNQENNFLSKLPSTIISGHPDGRIRAEYLRDLGKCK